ncbi:PREDICTED: uncharacterized protein LOC109238416 isoform X2 [Nicotiana attenuata]|uniref:uncharacterized protein LOC109238416 isoform X2 n=1 Tax=Nicotiana attenuata TaxID=49451 RepID=UPI0009051778|nr:PREDICTED: uncharacterized protein LOC109238416 isoform X2 [Nicotiana attenuata]
MEESEKRKERLKAIREEAAEAVDNSEVQKSIGEPLGDGLINPLIESPSASQPCNTPRPRPTNAGSPAYHVQGNYNSAKKTYQPRGVNAIPLGIRRKTSPICTPMMIAFLKEVETVANIDKAAPTKVQDSEAAVTEVQDEARVY